ncbi:hypothetical protein A3C98_03230 [Candidatus Roizmanbacteria bacterium RIFCSPHIGHO2_02_FULL_37_15]|uniref:Cohesin domain-containing protein n=1 Tax=Candidatus Roizmanbacteria bacterium RIFCSPLOWO2_01_FULL_37_16 TaxID=1802058 RepID=A0A1F7IQ06_9BACT|nr:MAG: hypothetical protein A2859_05430 [Candidatus Roizmanbacteria bacterium RIFCSPHIGHO2_01_FULL_37_16b]OGK22244.1 MAG: hypothetical protein A3C98_03230 [Candidatus Roizmanbacteria bacterium RIFCSPHIGHO2_02_FULL_37_15]OGK31660.1 MAG: hypothetical protein A3F57_02590 [Candidatus Roizmanbacteria bacterium RIFCSPHIGHO2_12_FULL_36_11]OGK45444.1 MAG: hypothetical protein A3B40_05955 [Candidatus Roizmanbacteria bacterium RIFCSPLOWO2_01_FULL_37_16]
MDPQTNNPQKNMLFRILILLIIIVFVFMLLTLYRLRNKTGLQDNFTSVTLPPGTFEVFQEAPNQEVIAKGSFSVQSVSPDTSGQVDKALDLEIVADSSGSTIVGYDIILKFEPDQVEIISATSLLPDFSVFPIERSDHYIVTGAKKLDSDEPSVFANTQILRLTVMPKVTGSLNLKLIDAIDLEKSQMVDNESKILTPQLGEVTLEIE